MFHFKFIESSILSYMIKDGYASEEDDANNHTEKELAQRDNEVNVSITQSWIENILQNAELYAKEPITNNIDPPAAQLSCKVNDQILNRLNKVYPMQKSVWPFILNKQSVILIGNTDYYPHLVYLPAICDLLKVIFFTHSEWTWIELALSRLIRLIFIHNQTARNDDNTSDDADVIQGPKVIILEQKREIMEVICRLGTCYFGEMPPSSRFHFNNSYDSNGLHVSDHFLLFLEFFWIKKCQFSHAKGQGVRCMRCFLNKAATLLQHWCRRITTMLPRISSTCCAK